MNQHRPSLHKINHSKRPSTVVAAKSPTSDHISLGAALMVGSAPRKSNPNVVLGDAASLTHVPSTPPIEGLSTLTNTTPKKVTVRVLDNDRTRPARGSLALPDLVTTGQSLTPSRNAAGSVNVSVIDDSHDDEGEEGGEKDTQKSPMSNPPLTPQKGSTRTLRVRQSLRTNYESRLAALEMAENEQRARLSEPYRRRLMGTQKKGVEAGSSNEEESVSYRPPESEAHRRRRESKETSAFTNPYNNSYYAYFQSEEGDDVAWGKAMGLPPSSLHNISVRKMDKSVGPPPLAPRGGSADFKSEDGSRCHPQSENDSNHENVLTSAVEQENNSKKPYRRFSNSDERLLAERFVAQQPQWRQKELRQSRHLLTTLHPSAATTYVKYQKLHDLMVAEDRAFEQERKKFLQKGRRC